MFRLQGGREASPNLDRLMPPLSWWAPRPVGGGGRPNFKIKKLLNEKPLIRRSWAFSLQILMNRLS